MSFSAVRCLSAFVAYCVVLSWRCLCLVRPHSYFAYATVILSRMKSRSVHDFSNFLLSLLANYNLKLIFSDTRRIVVAQPCVLRRCPPPPGHIRHHIQYRIHPSAICVALAKYELYNTLLHICSTFLCISHTHTHTHTHSSV